MLVIEPSGGANASFPRRQLFTRLKHEFFRHAHRIQVHHIPSPNAALLALCHLVAEICAFMHLCSHVVATCFPLIPQVQTVPVTSLIGEGRSVLKSRLLDLPDLLHALYPPTLEVPVLPLAICCADVGTRTARFSFDDLKYAIQCLPSRISSH